MRYGAEHKAQTRQRVLQEAAKAIRAEGLHKVGVAAVMARAGLTHGGFYAHFANKDEFLASAIDQMFREGGERMTRALDGREDAAGLADYLDFYLSTAHRDSRTSGCPLPVLSADAPRLDAPTRAQVARGAQVLTGRLARILAALGHDEAEDEAGAMLSEMVGAVSLARAEPDPERSDRILARTRTGLKRRLGLAA